MGSFTYQTIVLVLIGAAVFVLGTTNIRGHFRMKRPGMVFEGKVLNAKLVERRDKEDRLIQHYYELQVQCRTQNKTFNHKIKSTTEYEKGEEIQLMQNGGQITMVSNKSISLGIAILIAFAGMALAVFPVVYQCGEERRISCTDCTSYTCRMHYLFLLYERKGKKPDRNSGRNCGCSLLPDRGQ